MTKSQLIAVLILSASLSACGGKDPKPIDCEEGLKYQNREQGKRVVVPEGLDPLNEFAEMPIPKADPEAPEPVPGKCVDMPPTIR
ncbi:MAG: hypothetical protein OER91_01620 [Gammaproteobacteria bacterium]|nr:hypothetical protein [Gammaproteobacteria bacterium]